MTSALRGEGVPSKTDIVSNLSKGGCVNLQTGGRGSKNPKILRTSLMEAPFLEEVFVRSLSPVVS